MPSSSSSILVLLMPLFQHSSHSVFILRVKLLKSLCHEGRQIKITFIFDSSLLFFLLFSSCCHPVFVFVVEAKMRVRWPPSDPFLVYIICICRSVGLLSATQERRGTCFHSWFSPPPCHCISFVYERRDFLGRTKLMGFSLWMECPNGLETWEFSWCLLKPENSRLPSFMMFVFCHEKFGMEFVWRIK